MRQQLALLAGVVLASGPAFSTTYAPATTCDFVQRAECVCCVQCERIEVRPEPATATIFTYVTFHCLEDLKGKGDGPEFTLRLAGGTYGNRSLVVDGMPRFHVGDESVLFLGRKNRAGFRGLLQAGRGVLPLRKNKEGVRLLAARVTGMSGIAARGPVTMDDFRGAVRRVLAAEKAKEQSAQPGAAQR